MGYQLQTRQTDIHESEFRIIYAVKSLLKRRKQEIWKTLCFN